MDSRSLTQWSVWLGLLGVLAYVISVVLLWQGGENLLFQRFDHKDLFFGGSGLLLIAIWLKLGAIYHKGQ